MQGNPDPPPKEIAAHPIYGIVKKLYEFDHQARYQKATDALWDLESIKNKLDLPEPKPKKRRFLFWK